MCKITRTLTVYEILKYFNLATRSHTLFSSSAWFYALCCQYMICFWWCINEQVYWCSCKVTRLLPIVCCIIIWIWTWYVFLTYSPTSLIKNRDVKSFLKQSFNSDLIISSTLNSKVKNSSLPYTVLFSLLFSDSDSGSGRRSGGESTSLYGRCWCHKRMTHHFCSLSEDSGNLRRHHGENRNIPGSVFHTFLESDGGLQTSVDYKKSFELLYL